MINKTRTIYDSRAVKVEPYVYGFSTTYIITYEDGREERICHMEKSIDRDLKATATTVMRHTFEFSFEDEDGFEINYIFAFHPNKWNLYVEQSGELNFVATDGLEVEEPHAFDYEGFAYMKCAARHDGEVV